MKSKKVGLKFAALFALLWVVCKLIIFNIGKSLEWYDATALLNSFFLIAAISVGLFLFKKSTNYEKTSFFSDVKQGVANGFVYTILVAAFSQFFYSKIDPSFLDKKIDERMVLVENSLNTDAKIAEYKSFNTGDELLTKDEILAKIRNTTKGTLTANVQTVMILLGFSLLSIIYSIIITLLFQRVLLKGVE